MNDEPIRTTDMVDVTDSFEAVSVFRRWRSLFFAVVVASMVVLQGTFWLVDTGMVKPRAQSDQVGYGAGPSQAVSGVSRPQSAEDSVPAARVRPSRREGAGLGLSFEHLARLVQVANGVLLLAALLYWLTMLFTLAISIVGRLGGMNHICRAFFMSLVVLVLLIPWQHFIDSIIVGATFSVQELADGVTAKTAGLSHQIVHYLRFPGYSLVVLVILILAHRRSARWARVVLHRLEIL
jgi:hypothetical protein